MALLQLEKINYSYGDRTVLKDVTLELEVGKMYLICGKTGSGKTTLLKAIYEKYQGRAGYVKQNPDEGIVCDRVYEELAFSLENQGANDDYIRARIAETATYFGISHWMYKRVDSLSGGEKQILNIAQAMVSNPELLILDEPVSMLDPVMSERVIGIINRLRTELGITVVIAEHMFDNVFSSVDRVMLVSEGRVYVDMPDKMLERIRADVELSKLLPLHVREFGTFSIALARSLYKASPEKYKLPDKNIPPKNAERLLTAKGLCYAYSKENPILRDIDIELFYGEALVIIGGNGSGKTTLAKLLSGAQKPYSGKVKRDKNTTVKMLFQDVTCHFFEDECQGDFAGRHPYDLSGGERQLYALSRLLEDNPQVLVLDEPTKGLDNYEKEILSHKLFKLKEQHKGMIIMTHDIEFAEKIADRIGLLFAGEMAFCGTPEEFFKDNIFYTTAMNRIMGE